MNPEDVHRCTYAGSCCLCGRAAEATELEITALVKASESTLSVMGLLYVECAGQDHVYLTLDRNREIFDPFPEGEPVES